MLYLRGDRNKGLAAVSETIVLVRIKICLKGFVLVVTLLWEETAQQMINGELYSFIFLPTYK